MNIILSATKARLQSYRETAWSSGGVNQITIFKYSKDLSEYKQSKTLSSCQSINTFDFPTLYTSIPFFKLKDKLKELLLLCFINRLANVDKSILS